MSLTPTVEPLECRRLMAGNVLELTSGLPPGAVMTPVIVGPGFPTIFDDQSPKARLEPGGRITEGTPSYTFTITYTDQDGVRASDLDVNDLIVMRGDQELVVQSVSVPDPTSGTPRTAAYTVAPADGAPFDAADNGVYSVGLKAGQVADVNGLSKVANTLAGVFGVAIPGDGPAPAPLLAADPPVPFGDGTFGDGDVLTAADPVTNALVSLSLTRGTGQAFVVNGRIDVQLDGTSARSVFAATSVGRFATSVAIGNVVVNGSLRSVRAPDATVSGIFAASGSLGTVKLEALSDSQFLVGGSVARLDVGAVSNTGVSVGAAVSPGGGGGGLLRRLTVAGFVADSIITAGVDAGADGAYDTADDFGAGTGESVIRSVTIRSGTAGEVRFIAAGFARVARLPNRIVTGDDDRFRVLP